MGIEVTWSLQNRCNETNDLEFLDFSKTVEKYLPESNNGNQRKMLTSNNYYYYNFCFTLEFKETLLLNS